MCWALLWPIQVSFQVQVGPKMGVFWSKIAKMKGCHIDQKNQPGNWIMGQNTLQAIGKDVLGTYTPHPGDFPCPGGSKNGCFLVELTGCHIEQKIQPGNWIMGPNTPQAMGIVMLGKCCTRFSGRLSVYFEVYVVCGNVTQWTAIPILMVVDPTLHLRKEARALIIGFSCLGGG